MEEAGAVFCVKQREMDERAASEEWRGGQVLGFWVQTLGFIGLRVWGTVRSLEPGKWEHL